MGISTWQVNTTILAIRDALRAFDRSLRRLTPLVSAAASVDSTSEVNGRSRPHLSAKARASMIFQGRYMGYMRQLKPR